MHESTPPFSPHSWLMAANVCGLVNDLNSSSKYLLKLFPTFTVFPSRAVLFSKQDSFTVPYLQLHFNFLSSFYSTFTAISNDLRFFSFPLLPFYVSFEDDFGAKCCIILFVLSCFFRVWEWESWEMEKSFWHFCAFHGLKQKCWKKVDNLLLEIWFCETLIKVWNENFEWQKEKRKEFINILKLLMMSRNSYKKA